MADSSTRLTLCAQAPNREFAHLADRCVRRPASASAPAPAPAPALMQRSAAELTVVPPATSAGYDLSPVLKMAGFQHLRSCPAVMAKDDFLSADEIERAVSDLDTQRFEPSALQGSLGSILDTSRRDSRTAFGFTPSHGLIRRRVAELLGGIEEHFLELQSLRYGKLGHFQPHYDAKDVFGYDRVHTFLLYLNTLPPGAGGHTVFPELGLRICPEAGRIVAWTNLDASGKTDRRVLHGGQVVRGDMEKLVMNIWVHCSAGVADDTGDFVFGLAAHKGRQSTLLRSAL